MKKNTPLSLYKKHLNAGDISEDFAQEKAINYLNDLYLELTGSAKNKSSSFVNNLLKKVFSTSISAGIGVRGLYLWGSVGRGKTFLVELFYKCLPVNNKMFIHYHRFMLMVHEELKLLKGKKDPLSIVAQNISSKAKIICFDEFYVEDIADAMLLAGLLEELFKRNVVMVMTSNVEPSNLYKNGLQRAKFLPAISLIKKHMQVFNLASNKDYRLEFLSSRELFFVEDKDVVLKLNDIFQQVAVGDVFDGKLLLNNRKISVIKYSDGIAWFDFATICGMGRSARDYIEIARCFHTVIISDTYVLLAASDDIARRFISLVDEFYAHNVKLVISSSVTIDNIYQGERLIFEFTRTISRLHEMQSQEYLAKEHLC